MPSSPDQIRAARAAKQAENQAHRAMKRKGLGTKVVTTEVVLSHNEKIVLAAVKAELERVLAEQGDAVADKQARNGKIWEDFAQIKYTKLGLKAFAAAEAARWYEARHPRPPRPEGAKGKFGDTFGGDRGRR